MKFFHKNPCQKKLNPFLKIASWCLWLCMHFRVCVSSPSGQHFSVLSSSGAAALARHFRPWFREPPPRPHPRTSSRWADARVIIFLGVAVYITQRILLKIRPPSVSNSGLISSRPSCWYACRPVNGHSSCYRQPLRAACCDPARELGLRRTQCSWGLKNTHSSSLMCILHCWKNHSERWQGRTNYTMRSF